jgi:hypothetical protein
MLIFGILGYQNSSIVRAGRPQSADDHVRRNRKSTPWVRKSPALNTRGHLQNVTTAFYAHTVSVIEESWLDEIPGFNQRSIQQLSGA